MLGTRSLQVTSSGRFWNPTGFAQTLRKATAALTELAARLARGRTRRPPAKVQAETDTICAPRWLARVIATELTGDTPATLRLAWRIDPTA